jgi:tryptophanyl-tRNA synthetase
MSKRTVLTGITTSGTPHLGNYVGAIKPAIAASHGDGVQSCYFLADYHALIKCRDPEVVQRSTLEIAATWLALGLDTDKAIFYRQSDIPEISELTWLLTCITAKGLMNRAHAYKAAVQDNLEKGEDADFGVAMGLFSYPILMAADILMFNANDVPVGRDQVQHLEMARDIAQRFNHHFGQHFVLPEAVVDDKVAVLPGQDGRKMSKSYNNSIPLQTEGSALYAIYSAFANEQQRVAMQQSFADGIGWGDAKQQCFELINSEIANARSNYEELISNPAKIEQQLQRGAERAREITVPFIQQLRSAVGIRSLTGYKA